MENLIVVGSYGYSPTAAAVIFIGACAFAWGCMNVSLATKANKGKWEPTAAQFLSIILGGTFVLFTLFLGIGEGYVYKTIKSKSSYHAVLDYSNTHQPSVMARSLPCPQLADNAFASLSAFDMLTCYEELESAMCFSKSRDRLLSFRESEDFSVSMNELLTIIKDKKDMELAQKFLSELHNARLAIKGDTIVVQDLGDSYRFSTIRDAVKRLNEMFDKQRLEADTKKLLGGK